VQSGAKPIGGDAASTLSKAFQEVAAYIGPAVVNINTEGIVKLRQRDLPEEGNPDMPDMFRRFFGTPDAPREFTRRSLGSGVIVDPKGYIITNDHVIEGARKIKVTLSTGEEYIARVIAGDPGSDIAVIKIDGTDDFPTANVGDSQAIKVGDWVIAIGSPFSLEQTVTAGIISAKGRVFENNISFTHQLFNDFLQTDAAVNQGNSGGPLVNMNGEVVGINSFISTRTGSNAGVSFAVPSHIFVDIYNQILEKGRVRRGYLGVSMNLMPFTSEMADYFGVKQGSGVLITDLSDQAGNTAGSGPAAKAGIKPEDVIVEFGGTKVMTVQDLRQAVARTPPGMKAPVKVVRFGKEMEFEVTLVERTLENQPEPDAYSFEEPEQPKTEIGLSFETVEDQIARELDIPGGALLNEVAPGSLAEEAGLISRSQNGFDIIIRANGEEVLEAEDLLRVVKGLRRGEAAIVRFLRVPVVRGRITSPTTYYTSFTKP
jgi:serine protease Do